MRITRKLEVRSKRQEVRSKSLLLCFFTSCFFILFSAGCGDDFFDPTQIGRFRPVPAVHIILDSLGVAEETPVAWDEAEEPRPIDMMVFETDYVFGTGDIVRISIFELLQEGVSFERDYVITETGKLSIQEVGIVEAAGLTETQLEDQIKQILSPSILKEPSVTVTSLTSEQRAFSISGNGVPRPGRYAILRYDFRLTDAIAIAGGISQFNISYVYVSRIVTGAEPISEPVAREDEGRGTRDERQGTRELIVPEDEMLEIIAPRAQRMADEAGLPLRGLVIASAEMAADSELLEAALPELLKPEDGQSASSEAIGQQIIDVREDSQGEPTDPGTGRIEWVFKDGRWVPVRLGPPEPELPVKIKPEVTKSLTERVPQEFGWEGIGAGGIQTRLIKIPQDKLFAGDARYNIIIRPGDSVYIPVDIIGEFYIMGNTNFQGFINLTGRPMTLKMAIASAGGLGPLAWPKRCEVTRRISKNREEIVMVDLEKIARGEQPDFFIKPDDLINVGTHPTSIWRAILRNAFRATYGFGFVYDRNFANTDFGPLSKPYRLF